MECIYVYVWFVTFFTYYIYLDMFACSGPAGGRLYSKYYMGSPARTWLPEKCMTMRPSLAKSYLNQEPTKKKKFFCFDTIYTHLVIMEVWKLSFTAVDSDPVVFYIDNLYVDLTSQWVYWVSKDFGYIPCSLLEWIRLQTGHLACMCVTQSY